MRIIENKSATGASVFSNFLWRFFERSGAQGIRFLVELVLARLLLPEIYGTVALVSVFTNILQVFVDSGLGNALIQKKNADDLDFSSVFFCNMTVCLLLYGLLFLSAPWLAAFYRRPELTAVIRVLGLTLVISGVKNIQQAYVSRHMLFKRFFFATLGGTIGAAFIGIWMAYRGYGVWALVAQNLFNKTVDTCILWLTVRWRPKRMFSWARLKGLFSYGWKLLASALLDTVYNNLRQLVIGKLYSSGDLAFYNRGHQFPEFIVGNINTSIDSVLFPTMSAAQEERKRVKQMTRRAMTVSVYLMAPLMAGIAACAVPLVRLVLTEKWLPCVPFLRIFCVSFLFYPIHTANLNAIKAMGRSDLFLKLEIQKKIMGSVILLGSMWFGVMAMACSTIVSGILGQIINSRPNWKLLDYSYWEQLRDILPSILLAIGMGIIVYGVQFLGLSDLLTLLVQVPLGAGVYVTGSWLLRLDSFRYVLVIGRGMQK